MKDKNKLPSQPYTLVLDPKKGFYLDQVENPSGRLWNYGKQWVYLMKKKDDKYEPVDISRSLGETTPDKLYSALFWTESDILFSLQNTLMEKLNTFSTYLLIGILLFFIYLMYNSL